MEDENIFDEDDALDYIIYEELSKSEKNRNNSGCLTSIVAFAVPVGGIVLWLARSLST